MGFEKRDYSHSSIHGVVIPTYRAPIASVSAQITLSTPQAVTWLFRLPPDNTNWSVIKFSCFANSVMEVMYTVKINDDVVWGESRCFNFRWVLGVANTFKVTYPDSLYITLLYPYDVTRTVFWEMDFWRERYQ